MSTQPTASRATRRDCIHTWGVGRPLSDEGYLEQLRARFWAKVDKTPGQGPKGECWTYTGYKTPGGYGYIAFRFPDGSRRPTNAHRVAFFLTHGRLPENNGCHSCDNPPCVNPAHIWDGTTKENNRDAWKKGRMAACGVYQRPKPEKGRRIRFSKRQCRALRKAREKKGASIFDIAALIGVNFSYVSLLETAKRPSLPFEKASFLLNYLGAPFSLSDCTYVEYGTPGGKNGLKPTCVTEVIRVNPKFPHQQKGLSKFWRELPEPRTDLYRADLLRAALAGRKVVPIYKATRLNPKAFKRIMCGGDARLSMILRVALHAGVAYPEIFNTREAKAA